jgi:hypothetical protein
MLSRADFIFPHFPTFFHFSLTQRVNAQITENGIETPLGVLTIDQVEKGEEILNEIQKLTDPLTKSSKNQVPDPSLPTVYRQFCLTKVKHLPFTIFFVDNFAKVEQ